MTTRTSAGSREQVGLHTRPGSPAHTLLLLAGIAAVVVYAVGDVVSGVLYDGYSFRDQAISELSAYGSPVRPLAVGWIALHGLLGLAFSVGVWWSAGPRRALRWTAGLLFAAGVVTAPLHPFFPMSSRGMEAGFNDTMHVVLTMAFVPLMVGAVVASAVALRGWFRLYAIASLVVMAVVAGLTGPLMTSLAESLATPWLGVFERINAYTGFAWTIVLALVLLHRRTEQHEPEAPRAGSSVATDHHAATAGR
jgi:hypothetical membrane protein